MEREVDFGGEGGSHFWVRVFCMRLVMGDSHAEPHAKAPPKKRLRFERKRWFGGSSSDDGGAGSNPNSKGLVMGRV